LAIGRSVKPGHSHRRIFRLENLGRVVIEHRNKGLAPLGHFDEPLVLSLSHFIFIHVIGGEVRLMFRGLIVVAIVTAHLKRPFRNLNHLAPIIPDNRFVEAEVLNGNRSRLLGSRRYPGQQFFVLGRVTRQGHHADHHQKKRQKRRADSDHQPLVLH
jgi:hypothetical protein